MRYITLEHFLELDEKIKDDILKWWTIQKYDIVWDPIFGERVNAFEQMTKENKIPLLTLDQLIAYLEYKEGPFELIINNSQTLLEDLWEKIKESE